MKDIWTIPLAGLVAGIAGFLFGFPALRPASTSRWPRSRSRSRCRAIKYDRFETFTGGGGGINLFGIPGLTGAARGRRSR